MGLILNTSGAPSHLFSTYAPHQGATVDHLRTPYWEALRKAIANIPKTHFTAILGDMNVRPEARMTGGEHAPLVLSNEEEGCLHRLTQKHYGTQIGPRSKQIPSNGGV